MSKTYDFLLNPRYDKKGTRIASGIESIGTVPITYARLLAIKALRIRGMTSGEIRTLRFNEFVELILIDKNDVAYSLNDKGKGRIDETTGKVTTRR